jgi:hypothetical protein
MKIPKGLPQHIRATLLRGDSLDLAAVGGAILQVEADDKVDARDAQRLKALGSLPAKAFYHSGTWRSDPHPKKLASLVAADAARALALPIRAQSDVKGVTFTVRKDIEVQRLEGWNEPGARTSWGSIPESTVYARRVDVHLSGGATSREGGTIEVRVGKARVSVDVEPGTEKSEIVDLVGRALEKKKLGTSWGDALLVVSPR